MALNAAQLQISVNADTKDAQSGLSNILQTMLGFVGAQAIINAAGDAFDFLKGQISNVVSATNEQDQATALLSNAFKDTGKSMGLTMSGLQGIAEHLNNVTDFSKPVVEQAEAIGLKFSNIGASIFPNFIDQAANMATVMGTSLPAATKLLGKALDDPTKAAAALHRAGVDLTTQQQAQIKSFMAVGNVAAAQNIILGAVTQKYNDAAEAAGSTFGGAIQILKDKLNDLYATFGDKVEPILGKFVSTVLPIAQNIGQAVAQIFDLGGAFSALSDPTKLAGNAANLVSDALAKVTQWLGYVEQGIASGTGPMGGLRDKLVAIAAFVFQQLIPALQNLATFFTTKVIPAAQQLADFAVTYLLPAIGQFIGFVVSTVLPILGTLVDVFITDILPAVEGVAKAILTELLPPLESIMSKVLPVLNPILQLMGWILSNVVGPALQLVILGISKLLTLVSSSITVVENFANIGLAAVRKELGNDKTAAEDFITSVGGLLGGIGTFVQGAIKWFQQLGGAVRSIWDGIVADIRGAIDFIIGGINLFINALDNIKISIPSINIPGGGSIGGGSISFPHIPDIPLLANGGVVQSSGLAVVGDGGPELLSLPIGASVTPLSNTTGSSQPTTQTIVIQLDSKTLAQGVVKEMPSLVRIATGTRNI